MLYVSNRGKSASMAEIVMDLREQLRPSRPQQALLCDMDLQFRKMFFPLGFAVEILTNRYEVLEAAEASFGHMKNRHGSARLEVRIGVSPSANRPIPPPPVRREYNHLYTMVADPENQAVMDLLTGANFVWLNEAALSDELYLRHNFLEKVIYLLLGATVVTDIHAGCIGKDGKGVLLCGNSGAGKSTLSYACARVGWTYTSDDTCYLINASDAPRVIGHAHRVRFRPAAKNFFPELQDRPITPRMEGKPSIEVPVSELPPMHTSVEACVSAVVYLRRSRNAKSALIPLPAGSATRQMSDEMYSAGEIKRKHQRDLEKFAEIPTYELHYYSLEEAICELDQLIAAL